jgi:hypothetical protein
MTVSLEGVRSVPPGAFADDWQPEGHRIISGGVTNVGKAPHASCDGDSAPRWLRWISGGRDKPPTMGLPRRFGMARRLAAAIIEAADLRDRWVAGEP